MTNDNWSPHSRYRLYTTASHYALTMFDAPNAIETFEKEVCDRFNVAAAVCVPRARSGLFLTIREMIRPGQSVIMSPLTIVDVVNAVICAGGIPVFADILRTSCAIDPEQFESLIGPSTGAVLITHLHGETADAARFRSICSRRGIRLIEDAAQAFGAREAGKRLGTIGDAGIYSFGFYKHLTTWRGGMVVSNDVALIERIRGHVRKMKQVSRFQLGLDLFRGLAIDAATWPPIFAYLTHPVVRRNQNIMDRLLDPEATASRFQHFPASHLQRMRAGQARIGVRELERVDAGIQSRIAKAAIYHEGLDALPDIYTPRLRNGASNIYTYFPIQVANRRGLLRYAQQKGRDFAAQHLRNCADLEIFAEFYRYCPAARAAAQDLVLLPTYPGYPLSEIRENICVIQEWLSKTNIKGWKIKKDGRSTTTTASITAPDSLERPTTAIR